MKGKIQEGGEYAGGEARAIAREKLEDAETQNEPVRGKGRWMKNGASPYSKGGLFPRQFRDACSSQ